MLEAPVFAMVFGIFWLMVAFIFFIFVVTVPFIGYGLAIFLSWSSLPDGITHWVVTLLCQYVPAWVMTTSPPGSNVTRRGAALPTWRTGGAMQPAVACRFPAWYRILDINTFHILDNDITALWLCCLGLNPTLQKQKLLLLSGLCVHSTCGRLSAICTLACHLF